MQNISPCDYPIPYKIGSVDPKFGLSTSDVLADTTTATNILSQIERKQLFTYSNSAALTVNFVYDTRAELDTQINQLQTQLKEKGNTLDQQIKDYKSDANKFDQKLADFNATVEKYNSEGGAPPDVYEKITEQLRQLRAEADTLNQRARDLNLSTQEYNIGVSHLNQDASKFNDAIALKPEEGLYDEANNTITLYFASNQDELIHTLTHEFGHALGMQHVDNPEAIMYPYSTKNITPTPEDIEQFAYICKAQPLPIFWLKFLDKWLVLNIYPLIKHSTGQGKS